MHGGLGFEYQEAAKHNRSAPMTEEHFSTPSADRVAVWMTITGILGLILLANIDLIRNTAVVLSDRSFLRGFGNLLLITAVVSLFGGGIGVALSKLVQLSDWLTHSTVRLLHVGMWLPVFLFWALPIWQPGKAKFSDPVVWLSTLTLGVFAAGPTVILASCYYYLSSRVLFKLANRRFRFQVARSVFLLALLICLFWQLFLPSAWPWKWLISEPSAAASFPAVILLMAVVMLTNLISGYSLDRDMESRPVILKSELQTSDSRSLVGISSLSFVGLILWQLSAEVLKRAFLIEPPWEVSNAVYRLLITGTEAFQQTIWYDVRVSLQEIIGGVAVAALAALVIAEGFFGKVLQRARTLLTLTYIAPVALAAQILLWVGVGIWQKVLMVASLVFFPFVQALWSYRSLTLPGRFLVAIDESLPYAFVGMVFAEAYAATAGLGFVILVAASKLYIAEALAASFITFGLLAIISCVIRFVVKRLCFSEAEVRAVPLSAI